MEIEANLWLAVVVTAVGSALIIEGLLDRRRDLQQADFYAKRFLSDLEVLASNPDVPNDFKIMMFDMASHIHNAKLAKFASKAILSEQNRPKIIDAELDGMRAEVVSIVFDTLRHYFLTLSYWDGDNGWKVRRLLNASHSDVNGTRTWFHLIRDVVNKRSVSNGPFLMNGA